MTSHPPEIPPGGDWARFPRQASLGPSEEGHEAAWRAAYPILWVEGMKIARQRIHGERHAPNREDVVSDAILAFQIVVGSAKYDFCNQEGSETDGMRRMYCRIVHRKCADFFRGEYRSPPAASADTLPEPAGPEGADDGGFDALFDADRHRALRAAIEALEPPLPALFACRLEGLSAQETGDKLGFPRNTVLSHWSRGMLQLREILSSFRP